MSDAIISDIGDKDLFAIALIFDLSFVRPLLFVLIDLFGADVDSVALITAVFLGGTTGVSLNGTFGSVVACGGMSLVDFIVD